MTTNIIKVKFFKGSIPTGREYTYLTPEPVDVGDVVDIETKMGKTRAMVCQVDVPEAEIAPFRARAKSIIGRVQCQCERCEELTPIGEGDHICGADPYRMPVSDYMPTEDYFWCKGTHFVEG